MSSTRVFFPDQLEISAKSLKVLRISVSNAFRIPFKQLPLVIYHAFILSSIVAGFWLLDSLKDPVIARIIGMEYQPIAKVISVLATFIVTVAYDFLTSKLSKTDLFHVVSAFYGISFMIISAILADPEMGLASSKLRGPERLVGWLAYVLVESYGSLMVALFWSFTNSIMNLEEAKGAYGLIIAVAQIGAISGSTMATHAQTIGISQLFLYGAMGVFVVSLQMKVYCILFRKAIDSDFGTINSAFNDQDNSPGQRIVGIASDTTFSTSNATPSPALFANMSEGFLLVVRNRYMLMVLGVSCLYEVVVTVLDYHFKILAAHASEQPGAVREGVQAGLFEDQFANLLGHFGQATNLFSFFVSFFGFSFLVHRVGVRFSLMIFPTVLFAAVVTTNLLPNLKVLFVAVSIVKALVFSLHDPVKELLYIPTSVQMKFKAKAWIDVFGSRLAKALGSLVSFVSRGDAQTLRTISEVPCLAISVGVMVIAYVVGTEFQSLVDRGTNQSRRTVIGSSPEA